MVSVASTRELTNMVARAIRGTREMDITAARYRQLLLLKRSARLRSFQVCLQINLITNEKWYIAHYMFRFQRWKSGTNMSRRTLLVSSGISHRTRNQILSARCCQKIRIFRWVVRSTHEKTRCGKTISICLVLDENETPEVECYNSTICFCPYGFVYSKTRQICSVNPNISKGIIGTKGLSSVKCKIASNI